MTLQFPSLPQLDVITAGDGHDDLGGVRAQIQQAPKRTALLGLREGLHLLGGGQFEVQFRGDFRERGDELLRDVLIGEFDRRPVGPDRCRLA
jgi:hypothetical protein